MEITVRKYNSGDIRQAISIWNEIVEEGNAFPQLDLLDEKKGEEFFQSQSYTGVAVDENGSVVGLYILHPNNIGRCGHLCNASYAVKKDLRGMHIGEILVRDCMKTAKTLGFGILQFNAVVKSNKPALALYKKLGFEVCGKIPNATKYKDGTYDDLLIMVRKL